MDATVDVDAVPVPLARDSHVLQVYRYDPTRNDPNERYVLLVNVRVLEVSYQEGPHPGHARFRYSFDPDVHPELPDRVEDVWGFDRTGNVVHTDDRLVVFVYDPNAEDTDEYNILFDGFVFMPQMDLSRGTDLVTFEAFGTPTRLWDRPILETFFRDPDDPPDPDPDNPLTPDERLAKRQRFVNWPPVRFNPDGEGNASPVGEDTAVFETYQHPVFVDVLQPHSVADRRTWTLEMAAMYLLFTYNNDDYVTPADRKLLIDTLIALSPLTPDGPIDPNDPTTYTWKPIDVEDVDVTGDVLPVALHKVINPHGFDFCFRLTVDENGDPAWGWDVYRKDTMLPAKALNLQKPLRVLDPGETNVALVSLQRDGDISNHWGVLTAPNRYEGGFVLAPGFDCTADDGVELNLHKWVIGDPQFVPDKFRLFVFDEDGTGHKEFKADSLDLPGPHWRDFVEDVATSLDKLFQDGPDFKKNMARHYAHRRRRPENEMLSVDDVTKLPFEAKVHVSTDYRGPIPGLWDGTGTWQEVTSANWALLKDRIGIRLTKPDLQSYNLVTDATIKGTVFDDNLIHLIWAVCDPLHISVGPDGTVYKDEGSQWFCFRLTAVVEGDWGLGNDPKVDAPRRPASPVGFDIQRVAEVRDRFRHDVVDPSSCYALPDPDTGFAEQTVVRDDLDEARAHAAAMRKAHELAVIAGPVTIPRVTFAYNIGDRVKSIDGRGIDLNQSASPVPTDAPVYPCVVGITWRFDREQATVLQLSDRRAEPAPERRR